MSSAKSRQAWATPHSPHTCLARSICDQRQPGRADREEQLGVGVATDGVVAPLVVSGAEREAGRKDRHVWCSSMRDWRRTSALGECGRPSGAVICSLGPAKLPARAVVHKGRFCDLRVAMTPARTCHTVAMLVLAHRGASRDAPENTPDAFRLADRQGADGVELDVRLHPVGSAARAPRPAPRGGRHRRVTAYRRSTTRSTPAATGCSSTSRSRTSRPTADSTRRCRSRRGRSRRCAAVASDGPIGG